MTLNIPKLVMAELSTSHMTEQDNECLGRLSADEAEHPDCIGRVIHHEYGYFVSLSYDDSVYETQESWAKAMQNEGFSTTFATVCGECKKAGFEWVYFDRDADTVDGLPTEEW